VRFFTVLLLAAGLLWASAKTDWDALRSQMRQTLHVPDPLPNVADKLYGRFSPAKDVTADRVSFATDYGLRVPAIVYHQAGVTITKHPALIIVNGHNGDKSSWYAYWAGILYARAGAVVLTYDPIGEFERNWQKKSATRQHDTELAPDDMARRLSGLMITDIMQSARYLAQRPDVDPKSIAVLGYSMGSLVSSFACALDTSLRVCVLMAGGDLDGPDGYWDKSAKMCQGIPYRSLAFLGERGPIIYGLNAKRGLTFVYNGTADTVVDITNHGEDFFAQLREQTVNLLGNKKDVFDYAFLPGGGHRPYFLTRPVALWLNDKLKFPNWTKKQLLAMPETHVSEWAIQNHIQDAPSLASELNEGGTMALGSDIPVVPRSDLRAIPDVIWDAAQDNYVYESWRKRAQAALAK
jgi:dienelactone hydrolase